MSLSPYATRSSSVRRRIAHARGELFDLWELSPEEVRRYRNGTWLRTERRPSKLRRKR